MQAEGFFHYISRRLSFLLFLLMFFAFSSGTDAKDPAANIWYVGEIGLEFSGEPPAALTDSVSMTSAGSAVISDSAGRLLFYTDGFEVWDRNHRRMPNGTGLKGSQIALQPAIIIPYPDSSSLYALFTASETEGLHYSIVDMNRHEGDGDLTEKNIRLQPSTAGKITAVRHRNGRDYWVIAPGGRDNSFSAYLISASGVQTPPVVSHAGIGHSSTEFDFSGQFKASPDGKTLALAVFEPGFIELFDFDDATGVVSNARRLEGYDAAYGSEFSPDSRTLYAAMLSWANRKIYQFDLDADDIPASAQIIGEAAAETRVRALQVALDGKVYVSRENALHLGVINAPNQPGKASDYVDEGVYLDGRRCGEGLPTFVQSFFTPPVITISINDASADEHSLAMTFTVSLSERSDSDVLVDYATQDGTATAGNDYTASSGTLTIPVGALEGTISIPILDDAVFDEGSETFTVELSNPVRAVLDAHQGTGTIRDNDAVEISIADAQAEEGRGRLVFPVSLAAPSQSDIRIDYTTRDGAAGAGREYTAVSGTLTIPAGEPGGLIQVALLDDSIDEEEKTFTIQLSNTVNGKLLQTQAVGTILDDDPPPALTIEDAAMQEQTGTLSFAARLSAVSMLDVSVSYATADGTAAANRDYTPHAGTLFIPAGQMLGTVLVDIRDDALNEAAETLTVRLSDPVNAALADGEATGVITDDDPLPTLACADVSAAENSGLMMFNVTLSAPSGQPVAVSYTTQDAAAVAGDDYIPSEGMLRIPAGRSSAAISLSLEDDRHHERAETFTVNLHRPVNAVLAQEQCTGTIVNDDPPPSLTVGDVTVKEGAGVAKVVISLSAKTYQDVSVSYGTIDDTATFAGDDYTIIPETRLNFPAGVTQQTIPVSVYDDDLIEGDEAFAVQLIDPVNATLADAVGSVTILNDDALPVVNVEDASIAENAGLLTFRVCLSEVSALPVIVAYQARQNIMPGTEDRLLSAGRLAITPDSLAGEIVVPIPAGSRSAEAQPIRLELSDLHNAIPGKMSGSATLEDDE